MGNGDYLYHDNAQDIQENRAEFYWISCVCNFYLCDTYSFFNKSDIEGGDELSEKAQMIFDIIGLLIVLFSSVVNDRYIHSLEKKIKETEVRRNDKVGDSKVHL